MNGACHVENVTYSASGGREGVTLPSGEDCESVTYGGLRRGRIRQATSVTYGAARRGGVTLRA